MGNKYGWNKIDTYNDLVQSVFHCVDEQRTVNYGDPSSVRSYNKRMDQIYGYIKTIDEVFPDRAEQFCRTVLHAHSSVLQYTALGLFRMVHLSQNRKDQILVRIKQLAKDDSLSVIENLHFQCIADQVDIFGIGPVQGEKSELNTKRHLEARYDALYLDLSAMDEQDFTEREHCCYSLILLEQEIENGGLLQFFTNSSGKTAQKIGRAFQLVQCPVLYQGWEQLLHTNHIDPADLSPFLCDTTQDYMQLIKAYDFSAFEELFYQNQSNLHEAILRYWDQSGT